MPIPEQVVSPRERPLLRDVCYDQIARLIEDGSLVPGEVLVDTALETWLGASRTPVREALNILSTEGLVQTRPQRYTKVSEHTFEEVLTEMRILAGLYELASRWVDLDAASVQELRGLIAGLQAEIDAEGARRVAALDDVHDFFLRRNHEALQLTAHQVRRRLSYTNRFRVDLHPWADVRVFATQLETALAQHPAILSDAYTWFGAALHDHLRRLAEERSWQQAFVKAAA